MRGVVVSIYSTAASGSGGGSLTGYTEIADAPVALRWNEASSHKIEVKRATVLYKDTTLTDWADFVVPTAFPD